MNLTKENIKLESCEIFDDDNYKCWTKKFKYNGIIFYLDTTLYEPFVGIGVQHPFMEIELLDSDLPISEVEDFIINYINAI